ncbi:MAG: hypothetical protein V3S89_12225, partial [Desulfobacterales bacterium]
MSYACRARRLFRIARLVFSGLAVVLQMACSDSNLNNPYPEGDKGKNTHYNLFRERPKHLDPIISYSEDEYAFLGQIYEPVVQYHYLKRPYELIPATATAVPRPRYLDKDKQPLPTEADPSQIAYSVYDIRIKPGIRYQPHPAFATGNDDRYLYHGLSAKELEDIYTLSDFAHTGTRELIAADYVYQIKRLAAFQNPEFYKRQSMRLSTARTPRVIACAEDLPQFVGLPRG